MRGLDGVYLTSVKRAATVMHAVAPDFVIACGDVLFFAGQLSQVSSVAEQFNLKVVADAFEEDLPAMMGSPRHAPLGDASTSSGDQSQTPSSDAVVRLNLYMPDTFSRPRTCTGLARRFEPSWS